MMNTILVPEEFIRWSNRRFADKPAADPSRIILEVRNAADDRLHEYPEFPLCPLPQYLLESRCQHFRRLRFHRL